MSVRLGPYWWDVGALLPARAIVSATVLDFTVANCASVRGAAQTMTVRSKAATPRALNVVTVYDL